MLRSQLNCSTRRKGITPVVAVVVLMIITVGAVGVVFQLTSSLGGSAPEQPDYFSESSVSVPGAYESNGSVRIFIQNSGDESFNVSKLRLFYSENGDSYAPYPIYRRSVKGIGDSVVADWRMDDPSSTQDLKDYSDTPYPATLGTSTSSEASDPSWRTDVCVRGGCLYFDGNDDLVELSAHGGSYNRTKMAWIMIEEFDDSRRMGILSPDSWNNGDMHFHTAYNTEQFGISSPNLGVETYPIENGSWKHVAVSYNSATGNSTVLLNGRPVTEVSGEEGEFVQPDRWIGMEGPVTNNRNFYGLVDEARVYTKALKPDQIRLEMAGDTGCFEKGGMLAPGDTYNCSTGAAMPVEGDSISFRVKDPELNTLAEHTCSPSGTAREIC